MIRIELDFRIELDSFQLKETDVTTDANPSAAIDAQQLTNSSTRFVRADTGRCWPMLADADATARTCC